MVDRRAEKVRAMFGEIAPRYDLLNRLLSLSVDRYWRWRTRRVLSRKLPTGNAPLLDLCTGTGDLALELSTLGNIVGCDFSHPMLTRAREKVHDKSQGQRISLIEGDALSLPFQEASFRSVSVAFGFRNMESYPNGLAEMARVLQPGGILAILEFSEPKTPGFKQIYHWYFRQVLPRIGRLISGQSQAYSYLPESVREFPPPKELTALLQGAGFRSIEHRALSLGIATLTIAERKGRATDA